MKRGEVWWAELGPYRLGEQTGHRPVVIWQSDTLTKVLQTVLVIPLTTNKHRAQLAGTAMIASSLARGFCGSRFSVACYSEVSIAVEGSKLVGR